jgi:hypothetical protein
LKVQLTEQLSAHVQVFLIPTDQELGNTVLPVKADQRTLLHDRVHLLQGHRQAVVQEAAAQVLAGAEIKTGSFYENNN